MIKKTSNALLINFWLLVGFSSGAFADCEGWESDKYSKILIMGSPAAPGIITKYPFTSYEQIQRDQYRIAYDVHESMLDPVFLFMVAIQRMGTALIAKVSGREERVQGGVWIRSAQDDHRALFAYTYSVFFKAARVDLMPDQVVTPDLTSRDLCEEAKRRE